MITVTRSIIRELGAAVHSGGKSRPIVLELHPHGGGHPGPAFLGFRLKGSRKTHYVEARHCYLEAMRCSIAARKAARTSARKKQTRVGARRAAVSR